LALGAAVWFKGGATVTIGRRSPALCTRRVCRSSGASPRAPLRRSCFSSAASMPRRLVIAVEEDPEAD